jgi:hypothetical protein
VIDEFTAELTPDHSADQRELFGSGPEHASLLSSLTNEDLKEIGVASLGRSRPCILLLSRAPARQGTRRSAHRHGVAAEWGDILRDLDRLQEIELEQEDGKRFLLRSPTIGVAGKLFQAVDVALPPNVQELPLPASQSPA